MACALALAGAWVWGSTSPLIGAPQPAPTGHPNAAPVTRAIDSNDLLRHWVRSYEEESAGDATQVFRPAGFKTFPPSRFRMAYKFAPDGRCEWYFLSADDNHRFRPGRWTLDADDRTVLRITADGTTTAYRITGLSGEMLRLTPTKTKSGQ